MGPHCGRDTQPGADAALRFPEGALSTLPSSTVQPAAGLIHTDILLASFPEAKPLALGVPPKETQNQKELAQLFFISSLYP